jgi:hypothetical protein
MTPLPEPAGDIRAQLAAAMDSGHPKRAAFLVPANAVRMPCAPDAHIVPRPEGVLITLDADLARTFRRAPSEAVAFDRVMAAILGYPEDKALVVSRCGGRPVENSRAVQARDGNGWVVTETFASPAGLDAARKAMQEHVPPGGGLVELTATEAISRRVLLWEAGQ